MAEYIEREVAIAAIKAIPEGNWVNIRYVSELKKIPAADVMARKHGKWEYNEVCGDYFCSECGRMTLDRHDEFFETETGKGIALKLPNFCGYCGADVREVW